MPEAIEERPDPVKTEGPETLNWFSRQKDSFSAIATLFQIVAIILGGMFGAYQYLQNQQGDRVKKTLELVREVRSGEIKSTNAKLTEVWNARSKEIAEKLNLGKKEFGDYIMEKVEADKSAPQLFLLIDFYNDLGSCSEAKICDEVTARNYFCNDATGFFNLFRPFINKIREDQSNPMIALPLEKFVKSTCVK